MTTPQLTDTLAQLRAAAEQAGGCSFIKVSTQGELVAFVMCVAGQERVAALDLEFPDAMEAAEDNWASSTALDMLVRAKRSGTIAWSRQQSRDGWVVALCAATADRSLAKKLASA